MVSPHTQWAQSIAERCEVRARIAEARASAHARAVSRWVAINRTLVVVAALASAGAGATILSSGDATPRVVAGVLSLIAAAAAGTDAALSSRSIAEGHKRGYDGFTSLSAKWDRLSDKAAALGFDDAPDVRAQLDSEVEALLNEQGALSAKVPAPPWAWKTHDASAR